MTAPPGLHRRRRPRATMIAAMAIAASAAAAMFPAPASGQEIVGVQREIIDIPVDEARIVRLNRAPRSVIIGNPMVADAVIEENGLMILIGKTYGTTNLIALDEDGNELTNVDLAVRTSGANAVSLYRGTGRISYSCSPRCETELDVGDEPQHFDAIRNEITGKIGISQGQLSDGQ